MDINFRPDLKSLGELIKLLPPIDEKRLSEHKSPANAVTQPVNPDFLCHICSNVVEDVCCCAKCDKFYCSVCISFQSEKECPSCHERFEQGKVNKVILNMLTSIVFNCDVCTKTYNYSESLQHRKFCLSESVSCVTGCGCD